SSSTGRSCAASSGRSWESRVKGGRSRAVLHALRAGLGGAVRAAIEGSRLLHPVPDDLDAAVRAGRGQGVDGALERVKRLHLAPDRRNREGFVVVIAADITP